MANPVQLDPTGNFSGPDSGSSSGSTSTTTSTSSTGPVGSVGAAPSPASIGAGGINIGGVTAKVAVADVPAQADPVLRVLPGERVYIRPLPGNTKPVQIAQYALAAKFGPFDYVAPGDTEREYPVDSTGRIFVCQPAAAFVAGEGVAITIRRSN